MSDLTQDNLMNLGEWIKGEANDYPYLKIGNYRLIDRTGTIEDSFCITKSKYDFGEGVISEFKATTKEKLSNMCFFCEGKPLDFEPKALPEDFSWAACYKGGFWIDTLSDVWGNAREEIGSGHEDKYRNVCRTEAQANSLLAESQLTQIVAEINEKFKAVDEYTYFPILDLNDEIRCFRYIGEINNIGCHSTEGFEMLLKTNTPLLLQYFMQAPSV